MKQKANITVKLRHETGRTETIPNCRDARVVHDSELIVDHLVDDQVLRETYDALSWRIVGVSHTDESEQQ